MTRSDETDDPPALASPEPMAIPSLGAPPAPKTPGRHERCPHCGAITFLEKSTRLRYKCGVCGKARVPVDDPKIVRSNAEKDALERASRARNAQAALSVVSGIAAALGAVSLVGVLILVLALSPGFFLSSFALVAALAPMLVAAFGVVRARRRHAEIEPALLEAWQSVAADVVDARKEVTAGELAKVLRTTSDHAEQLLAYLLATGAATSPMTDDGEVRYRSSKAPIRVAEFEEDSPVPPARATRDAPQAEDGNTTTAADEAVRDALAEDELADEQAQEEAARAAAKERKVT